MVVYGDILFLINFSMDFLCFYLSSMILGERLRTGRAVAAASLGGIYSVCALFISTGRAAGFLLDMAFLLVMCAAVYAGRGMRLGRFVGVSALYLAVSALLGGIMTSLFYLFNRSGIFENAFGMGDGIDVWIFALLAVVSTALTLRSGRAMRASCNRGTAEIYIKRADGAECRLRTLVDSGNLAREPISGKSVAFASLQACKQVLDPALYDSLCAGGSIDTVPPEVAARIRLIPGKSVTGSSIIPAVRLDAPMLVIGGRTKEIDVYFALVPQEMLGEYDAIISHDATI